MTAMERIMSEILQRARNYETAAISRNKEMKKALFHVCSPVGWMNDPNGFSKYNGEYHLFFQYHPYGMAFGPIHWGHVKTRDFLKWEYLPCALAPDTEYDSQGCFSGSAIEWEGKHVLAYTGVKNTLDRNSVPVCRQTQCIAIGDGINYEKISMNPVITSEQLPEGSSQEDFRDPKIYSDGNVIYMVVGSRAADGSGQILMYKTKDFINWEFVSVLDQSNNELGKMWECPDYFELNGKKVLIFSPQEVEANEEFHNGNCTAGIVGHFDKETGKFQRENIQAIDYGLDYYAPQTLETEDGRRIMIGWLQSWDNHFYPKSFEWSGMMSIPRELRIENGRIYQEPVREIMEYYVNTTTFNEQCIRDEVSLDNIQGRHNDLTVELVDGEYESFTLKVAVGNGKYSSVTYNRKEEEVEMSREFSGIPRDIIMTRKVKVSSADNKIKIRIIIDSYSLEIFINDGQAAMSMLIFTELKANGITFQAKGTALANICCHNIEVW